MSISISWQLVKPPKSKRLPGTNSDWDAFKQVFGQRRLARGDVTMLLAMHIAVGIESTLWGALADAINDLPQDAEIEVSASW